MVAGTETHQWEETKVWALSELTCSAFRGLSDKTSVRLWSQSLLPGSHTHRTETRRVQVEFPFPEPQAQASFPPREPSHTQTGTLQSAISVIRKEELNVEGVMVFIPDGPPRAQGQSLEQSIAGQWLDH